MQARKVGRSGQRSVLRASRFNIPAVGARRVRFQHRMHRSSSVSARFRDWHDGSRSESSFATQSCLPYRRRQTSSLGDKILSESPEKSELFTDFFLAY